MTKKHIPVEINNTYTVEIESISSDGSGVGRIHGFTVFVPKAVSGDIVRARITKIKTGYCYAEAVSFLQESGIRTTAPCPVFYDCGGCSLMHIKYDEQLKIKKDIIINALKRIGGFEDINYETTIGTATPFRYRNKMVFPVGTNSSGKPICGFYRERSHDIVELSDCIIGDEINREIIAAVMDFIKQNNISIYDERRHTGLIRRIFTRTSYSSSDVMAVISINGPSVPKSDILVKKLTSVSDRIKSIILNINQKKNNLVLGDKNIVLYGADHITDELLGIKYEISPNSFYQVNPYGTEKLYKKALDYADIDSNTVVMDIYCGIGTISLSAAQSAKKVTGIEIVPQAIENAIANAKNNGIGNAEFFAGDASEIVPKIINGGAHPNVVILDPPRKGSDEVTLSAVISANPERIVYVSCNPSTLARDLKFLAQYGYSLDKVCGVDMFPHTTHVETVVLMSRVKD